MNTQIKFTTAAEAVKVIKSGDHIHLSSVASAPQCLIKAMCERGANHEFKDVHIHHLHTEGPAPYADPQFEGIFQLDSFFVGGNVRKVTQSGYADYIPIFLSETQKLYRSGTVPCDVAMIQVSTPDKHGYVSLGTSVDATLAAVETARTVIAVVNKHVPRSFGDAMIHSSKIDLFVQDDTPLEEAHFTEPNEIETRIGKHCAALIEDGATLQMGIGAIPNAVLAQLGIPLVLAAPRFIGGDADVVDRAQLAFEPVDLLGDEVRFELPGTPADADSRPAVAVGRDAQLCTVFQTAGLLLGFVEHQVFKALGMPQRGDMDAALPEKMLVQFGKVFIHFRELHAGVR